MPALLARLLKIVSLLLLFAGAAGVLAGALGPWATFRVFHNIEVSLPGFVFLWGGLSLSVASLVFFGAYRSPLLCLVGALLIFGWTAEAEKRVPERVKFQLAGAQLEAASSVNRLLDQFHIPDVQIADLNTPNPDLLGEGLGWTVKGAQILLLGSLAGLPGDPVAIWLFTHIVRGRCRACGARWLLARRPRFCPTCGTPAAPRGVRLCPYCHTRARRGDRHCVACGTALPSAANSLL